MERVVEREVDSICDEGGSTHRKRRGESGWRSYLAKYSDWGGLGQFRDAKIDRNRI